MSAVDVTRYGSASVPVPASVRSPLSSPSANAATASPAENGSSLSCVETAAASSSCERSSASSASRSMLSASSSCCSGTSSSVASSVTSSASTTFVSVKSAAQADAGAVPIIALARRILRIFLRFITFPPFDFSVTAFFFAVLIERS